MKRSFSQSRRRATARAQGYARAAKQARSSNEVSIQFNKHSIQAKDSLDVWRELGKAKMFQLMSACYDQVSLRRVKVTCNLSQGSANLNETLQSQGSLVYVWDRTGNVVRSIAGSDEYGVTGEYSDLAAFSSAQVVNGFMWGRRNAFTSQIYASSLQEKSLYVPTERLLSHLVEADPDVTSREQFNQLFMNWRPVLMWATNFQGQVNVQIQVEALCIFRGVRVSNYVTSKILTTEKLAEDTLGQRLYFLAGLARRVGNTNNYSLSGQDISEVEGYRFNEKLEELWSRGSYPRVYASLEKAMKGFQDLVAVSIKGTAETQRVVYPCVVGEFGQGGSGQIAKILSFNPLDMHHLKVKEGESATAVATNGNFVVSSGNQFAERPPVFGEMTREEDIALNRQANCLVVDEKLYDPSYGGINAVGYMDLTGSPDDDEDPDVNTGMYCQGNAWAHCGNKTEAELCDINVTNTGPEYVEVAVPTRPQLVVGTTEWATVPDPVISEGSGSMLNVNFQAELPDALVGMLYGLKVRYVINVHGSTNMNICTGTFEDYSGGADAITYDIMQEYDLEFTGQEYPVCTLQYRGSVKNPGELTMSQALGLYQLTQAYYSGQPENLVRLHIRKSDDISDYVVDAGFTAKDLLVLPVGASKVWGRIKAGFKKVFSWLGKASRKVVPIISPLIPPPYGTIVNTIGGVVSGVDTVINAAATTSQATTTDFNQLVQLDDSDKFGVTVQYRFAPASAEPADVTRDGTDWVDAGSFEVPLKGTQLQSYTVSGRVKRDAPLLYQQLKAYCNSLQGDTAPEVAYQVRARVAFAKKLSELQAKNFRAALRLGYQVRPVEEDDTVILGPADDE